MKTLSTLVVALAVFGASTALAQDAGFFFSTSSAPYMPLTNSTPLDAGPGASADEAAFVVALPFTFPYQGNTYTQVSISTNGFIWFGNGGFSCNATVTTPASCTTYNLSGASVAGNANPPVNFIAPWYDDLEHLPGGKLSYTANTSEVVIEWSNFGSYAFGGTPDYRLNMQVHLLPSGLVRLHYGQFVGATTVGSALAGFENASGQGRAIFPRTGALLACSPDIQNGCCASMGVTSCTGADWVADRVVTIGISPEADLAPTQVTVSNQTLVSGLLRFDVAALARNFGNTAANGWTWKVYLSADQTKDVGDVLAFTSSTTSSVAAQGSLQLTATVTAPTMLATGRYYALVELDSQNVVTEATKVNNVGVGSPAMVVGLDVGADAVSADALTSTGQVENVTVQFSSRGTVAPGAVAFTLYLTTGSSLNGATPIYSGVRTLATSGAAVNEVVPVTIPGIAEGTYSYALELDPANTLAEAIETNNVVFSSATVQVRQPDLAALSCELLDLDGGVSRMASFGDRARFTVSLNGADSVGATPYSVGVVLSRDPVLSLLSDHQFAEFPAPVLDGGSMLSFDVTLPVSRMGVPYATGSYYLFAYLDSQGQIFERDEGNNTALVGPISFVGTGGGVGGGAGGSGGAAGGGAGGTGGAAGGGSGGVGGGSAGGGSGGVGGGAAGGGSGGTGGGAVGGGSGGTGGEAGGGAGGTGGDAGGGSGGTGGATGGGVGGGSAGGASGGSGGGDTGGSGGSGGTGGTGGAGGVGGGTAGAGIAGAAGGGMGGGTGGSGGGCGCSSGSEFSGALLLLAFALRRSRRQG